MGFKGFICEGMSSIPLDGSRVGPQACLTCSYERHVTGKNHCPFTPPIVRGIIANNQPRDLMGYSVTELIGCHRRVVLKEEVDYWIEPSQAYWAFRGQLAHSIVEGYHNGDGELIERRFYADLDGMLITGQPDVVYPDEGLVVDYKTTKRVPKPLKRYACPACGAIIRENQWYARKGSTLTCDDCSAAYKAEEIEAEIVDPQPYDTHVDQLNVYAWLLAQNGITVGTAQVVYLDMSEPEVLKVELRPMDQVEIFVTQKLAGLMSRNGGGLPEGVWDDPDENWRCRYCAVCEQCEEVQAEETLQKGRDLLCGTAEARESI